MLDAASYYFDHALRLGQPDFEANDEDVIMTRIRTTGIDTTEFSEPPFMYSVVDVGGQRNERRKWIHCFDNVKVLSYCVLTAVRVRVSAIDGRDLMDGSIL